MTDKLYKPKEVAEILRYDVETIRRMCRNPHIKFGTKINGSWRISEADLNDLKVVKHGNSKNEATK